ncbi:nitrilase-related carbon-nitrogen hydrolase [Paenibacillus rhizophilus]|uniref:Acyltransferase n=1 Tax=Paenibacillus rhizophilus TaxID=1850366 RepID=A0A3N9PT74_9BACL|nr:nitrilase-related carbon-nitrogen hydrolase [Paenibacillus rhizophilus]RQW09582.1 acyltransferase [Paenibacillus rhizophilus]
MRKVKLALVQFESVVMDVPANVNKGLHFVREAARQGADLIVFPELFLTGCDTDVIGHRYHNLAQHIDGSAVQAFAESARTHNINMVIPTALKQSEGDFLCNSAVIIDRSGAVAGTYSKVHLWEDEKEYFKPGNHYSVFEMDFGKLGVLICYDAGFPEAARTLALQGAELIVIPSAFSVELKYRWDLYFQSRALENTCFVAAVNGSGPIGKQYMFGNNKIANPLGEIVLEGDLKREDMQVLEIDLDEFGNYSYPYLKDLRMDTYGYQA